MTNFRIDKDYELVFLFRVLVQKWLVISLFVSVASVATFVVSLKMPHIYRSSVLLAPAEESTGGGLTALAGQVGGLASLAGVNIGKPEVSKVTLAIEIMKSRAFVVDFVKRRDLVVPLFAAKGWDIDSNKLLIDEQIYDVSIGAWIAFSGKAPTDEKIYKIFMEMLSISQDKTTGMVTVAFETVSPILSRDTLMAFVAELNNQMRQLDISEASNSIAYLNAQLEKTSLKGMHQVFYQLIEKQMQKVMLAEVRDQYVFKVVDPPNLPEERIKPRRLFLVLAAASISLIVSIVFFLAQAVLHNEESAGSR